MKNFIRFFTLILVSFTPFNFSQSAGDLDTTFGIGGIVRTDITGYVEAASAVALQSDSKIILAGYSIESTSATREITLVRYMPDGSLDNTFGTNGIVISDITSSDGEAYSIAIQSDSKIVVAGYSEVAGINIENITVVRFNGDGTLDNTFGINGVSTTQISTANDVGYSVVIQNDGKIVVAGLTNQTNDLVLLRYNTDGGLDNSFGSGGIVLTDISNATAVGKAVALQEDGKILVTGHSDVSILVACYDSTGNLDGTFGNGGIVITSIGSIDDYAYGNAITIQQDGKILVAGSSNSSGNYHFTTVRYNSDGSLDNTFGSNGIRITGIGSNSGANSIALDQYGYIIVGGTSSGNFALARYDTIGNLDTGFGTGGIVTTNLGNNDKEYSLVIQSDNKIVLAGESEIVSDFVMARYLGFVPKITVTSPNGGEVWCGGTTQNITWEDNIEENVKIDLYKNEVYSSNIVVSTPSDGEYNWSFPGGMNPSPGYQIKISSVDDNNIFDFSDSTFTIGCNLTLVSPNGGEEWCAGTAETIIWTPNIAGNVSIDLFKSGFFHSIISGSTPNDSSMIWNIPFTMDSGSDYKIKIASVNDGNISDISDSSFSIISGEITVISPNGGEVWYGGTTDTIIWTSNCVDNVQILLYKGGSLITIISTSTLSDGSKSWIVPSVLPGSDYKVRISSVEDGNIFDESDAAFTITDVSGVEGLRSGIPDSFKLLQNYPNPFNPSTTIYYGLPEEASVRIIIYDVIGNEVMVFSEDKQEAGYHRLEFDATGLPSGIYFYQLRAGVFAETKKMILLK